MKLDINIIKELLEVKEDGILKHRESQTLEFKESFNFAGLAEYLRDFAAFANNRGGYLIFGVKDRPRRELVGLNNNAKEQIEKLDPEQISGHILSSFSGDIVWTHDIINIEDKFFGYFYIDMASTKPIICKADLGKDKELKNGEIYYRYGGRTQKIQYAELESIINNRIEANNSSWMDLMLKIQKAGPQNAAILDLDRGSIEKDEAKILVVDEQLVKGIKWIKEGEFVEKGGAKTLKLVGEVQPINAIEVIKKEKQNLFKDYPLSADELCEEIKKRNPAIGKNTVWKIIKENGIKSNIDYATYNFRNKKQEEDYKANDILARGVPSIYKPSTVDYIIKVFEEL